MLKSHFGKITVNEMRIFLNLWSQFKTGFQEAHQLLIEKKDQLLSNNISLGWCNYYELSIQQHSALAISSFALDTQTMEVCKDIFNPESSISSLQNNLDRMHQQMDESAFLDSFNNEDLVTYLNTVFGLIISLYNSMQCVLYHGCFMSELIQRIGSGDDKALFDAMRIDPTVIGCKVAISRISKATLLKDNRFFAKLKASMNGKMAKREQANYQKMRLVLEVLHEAGAKRLSDADLKLLFIEELKLYSSNSSGGGSEKALRKFADTYMKKNTTT